MVEVIHALNKGKNGEREIATLMNGILITVMREKGFPEQDVIAAATSIQRNQNQSAVGGGDLTHTLGLCIEIKRQEILHVESWWRQCEASAKRNQEWPVLLYRQNNKSWRCMTYMRLVGPIESFSKYVRGEMSFLDFQMWWTDWVKIKIEQGEAIRI